jgi:predicted nucleic acid-binding Zn ribbon protein
LRSDDFEELSDALDRVFARLGVESPALMARVMETWEEVAGKPWTDRARPVFIRGDTLVVEAFSPSAVALLRYRAPRLVKALEERFGKGLIEAVEVIPPGRS